MESDTILELVTRSIAKGPIGGGSSGYVYRLDDPELDGYFIKVRHEYLQDGDPSRLKLDVLRSETRIYGVDCGFGDSNVGQIMLCDENRRFFGVLKQFGEPLEARLKHYCAEGNNHIGANQLMNDLMALPDSGLNLFLVDIMKATHQNIGIDLCGNNNVFISDKGLHLLDVPIFFSNGPDSDIYFEPEVYNHLDAVNVYIKGLFEPVRKELTLAQNDELDRKIKAFETRLKTAAQHAHLPESYVHAMQYVKEHKIPLAFRGPKDVQGVVLTFASSRHVLKDAFAAVREKTAMTGVSIA